MPVGYLIPVVLVAWGAACALTTWRSLGAVAALPALVVNELPFITGLWLVGSSVLAIVEGDTSTAGGRALLAVASVTVAGLVVVVARALRAHAALGNIGPPDRPWSRIVRAPLFPGRRDVVLVRGLPYGSDRRQRLDVRHRRDQPSAVPVLVHLHGGAFRSGSRSREAKPLMGHLSSRRGFVCVSAGYRLQPRVRLDDQIADVHAALGWVRAHVHEYGGDQTHLILVGSSAGAYLALQAALDGAEGVVAVVGRYGYYGHLEPTPEMPCLLLVHGDHDLLVPADRVRRFADRARSVSERPVVYAGLPGAHHDFDMFESIRATAVAHAVEQFLDRDVEQARDTGA
jgi:acetyl esterase/lipase